MSVNQRYKIVAALLASVIALGLSLSGCGSPERGEGRTSSPSATPSPRSEPLDRSRPEEAEDLKTDDDTEDVAGNEDVDDEDKTDLGESEAKDFHGYRCTSDCSGHEAGYAWAEEKGIDDPDECGGNSQSFIEGCRAWAEENP